MTQHIRLSQFIHTYGPGALLESADGPRVILMPDTGLFTVASGRRPDLYEVSHQRMSRALLGGARIFRLPSNAELGEGERRWVYATRAFPEWSLCLNAAGHPGRFAVLYRAGACPACHRSGQSRRHDAIRFVMACPQGHLDDVDWRFLAHRGGNNACTGRSGYLEWRGGGGSLAGVRIQCPDCGQGETLGRAYSADWPCSGRHPERESPGTLPHRPRGCAARARILQRQATNLRVPELRALFTIPPVATALHNLLQGGVITGAISTLVATGNLAEQPLRATLDNLVAQQRILRDTADAILAHPWSEIQQAVADVLSPGPADFEGLLREEFRALLRAATAGYPPLLGQPPQSRLLFEVDPAQNVRVTGPGGGVLRITPIQRLQTITVQTGFRREISGAAGQIPTRVDVSFRDPSGDVWYPGAEFLGEGLFISLDGEGWHSPLNGTDGTRWLAQRAQDFPDMVFRLENTAEELHPVFVWWHTLAHLLIRSLSVDAGYSSSSIRERVYLEVEPGTGRARGGIVLYATQPGSEGSLGGLIALAPHFGAMLTRAVELARHCSNDPLCDEQRVEPGRPTGPACYGCLHASETSCEHRNLWLDRSLFLSNLP